MLVELFFWGKLIEKKLLNRITMLFKNKLFKLGIAAISANILYVIQSSFTPLPVKAWGPEYEHATCHINTGIGTSPQNRSFSCFIERSGGAGATFIGFIPKVGINSQGSKVLTINMHHGDPTSTKSTLSITWADGRVEKIIGEKYQGQEQTFWTERGWEISFYPPRNEDSY